MKFSWVSGLTAAAILGCRPGAAAATASSRCMVSDGRRTWTLRDASRGIMKRVALSGLVLTAMLAALASAPARAGTHDANPARRLVRSAPRSATASHQTRRILHHFSHGHPRSAALRMHAVTAAGARSRQAPAPVRPARPHRATLPSVKHGAQGPRALRGAPSNSAITASIPTIPLAVRDRSDETQSIRSLWLDPVRSGRGPPRAGPHRQVSRATRPLPPGHLSTPRSSRRLPGSRFQPSFDSSSIGPAPVLIAPDSPSGATPVLPHVSRPVFGRLLACRPEGTAARLITPS